MTRNEYMLEQDKDAEMTNISIDINVELLEILKEAAIKKNLSFDDFINIALKEKLIKLEKERLKKDYKNIIDIYDLRNIEDYMDGSEDYLVINPNGKHVVLIPHNSPTFQIINKIE